MLFWRPESSQHEWWFTTQIPFIVINYSSPCCRFRAQNRRTAGGARRPLCVYIRGYINIQTHKHRYVYTQIVYMYDVCTWLMLDCTCPLYVNLKIGRKNILSIRFWLTIYQGTALVTIYMRIASLWGLITLHRIQVEVWSFQNVQYEKAKGLKVGDWSYRNKYLNIKKSPHGVS